MPLQDSIDAKFESSRISGIHNAQQSNQEDNKNVSYELDFKDKLNLDGILNQRDRLNTEPIDTPVKKKSFHNSDLKTNDTKLELNLSVNAQLGEAYDFADKHNEPILEEAESDLEDRGYFFPDEDQKATLQMIRKLRNLILF